MKGYDIIGDVHGHALPLIALLKKLGYRERRGYYSHPERKAVFVGDFIDRGPAQRGVIAIVRPMIDAGAALGVMGNHEFNAICYHTAHPQSGTPLRRHTAKNSRQHQAFLDEYPLAAVSTAELIDWFRGLPLFLDLDGIRIIHACWHEASLRLLDPLLTNYNQLNDALLLQAVAEETPQFEAVETLLKGLEVALPEGSSFRDKDGASRQRIRTRWWESGARTYRDIAVVHRQALPQIPNQSLPDRVTASEYPADAPPVFFGHYWFSGPPARLTPNAACLDYSVANRGKLTAYRWCGEAQLDNAHFVSVAHDETEKQ
ncbi:MAG: metallophosphoesterase [Pseudomonadota bacterium]